MIHEFDDWDLERRTNISDWSQSRLPADERNLRDNIDSRIWNARNGMCMIVMIVDGRILWHRVQRVSAG